MIAKSNKFRVFCIRSDYHKEIETYKNSQKLIKHLIKIISAVRNLRSEFNIPYKKLIHIRIIDNDIEIIEFLRKYENELIRLLKITDISYGENSINETESAYLVIANTTIIIKLKGIINTNKELKRINDKKDKLLSQLSEVESKLKNSLFIAIDEEGGKVNRLKQKYGFHRTRSAKSLGDENNLDSTYYYSKKTSDLLKKLGKNQD